MIRGEGARGFAVLGWVAAQAKSFAQGDEQCEPYRRLYQALHLKRFEVPGSVIAAE